MTCNQGKTYEKHLSGALNMYMLGLILWPQLDFLLCNTRLHVELRKVCIEGTTKYWYVVVNANVTLEKESLFFWN